MHSIADEHGLNLFFFFFVNTYNDHKMSGVVVIRGTICEN